MLAGRYTLLEQDALDDLLPAVRTSAASASLLPASSTAACSPAHRSAGDARYDYEDAPPELVERARAIAAVCERHGTTLPAAAIAFPLAHPAVVSVCVGARSADQIERNAVLYRDRTEPELWSELKAEGLLRKDAPVPT